MSEEKKDELNERQDFLSGHQELLNSLNKETEAAPENTEVDKNPANDPEALPVEAGTEEEEASVVETEPEPEPISKTEETLPEPEPDSETPSAAIESESKPEPEPTPVMEEPVQKTESAPKPPADGQKPASKENNRKPSQSKKKKKKTAAQKHAERNEAEKQRHEELLRHQAMEQSEVREVLDFFRKYAKPAITVVVVVCAFFLINNYFKSSRLKKEKAADAALAQARTAADYQAILDDYGSTPSAPLATMALAREKFNAGNVDEAATLYDKFLKKHPRHEMAIQAEFNLITCMEAQGKLGEAHLLYGEFKSQHENSHLAPVALVNKARCLETLGQFAEAKLVYEDIITFYPDSGWSQMAEAKLNAVEGKLQ